MQQIKQIYKIKDKDTCSAPDLLNIRELWPPEQISWTALLYIHWLLAFVIITFQNNDFIYLYLLLDLS